MVLWLMFLHLTFFSKPEENVSTCGLEPGISMRTIFNESLASNQWLTYFIVFDLFFAK